MNGGTPGALLQASELLVGFVVVMGTLGLLWALTALMSRAVARWQPRPAPGPSAHASSDQPVMPGAAPDGQAVPDDEELAAVAAAVALMIDAPHRVVRVHPQPSAWGQEGRRNTHASHRMPR